MPSPLPRLPSSETGIVLISTLLLMALLLVVGASVLSVSRTDLMIARNLHVGTETWWIARAGTEIGKNWLENNLLTVPLPVTLGPTLLGNGTYTVAIAALGNNTYQLTATGLGPEGSRREIEEIVRLPNLVPSGVILNEGDGLHPDFDDSSGGTGRRIPDFNIDGRNHALTGALSATCPAVSSYAVTQVSAQSDFVTALNILKREVVVRANAYCQSNGSSSGGGTCTPGLSWIRGNAALPRFTSGGCIATDPSCFLNLDLSAAALRATAQPPATNLPPAPQNRGPFAPTPTATVPFTRFLTTTEQTALHTAIDDLLQRTNEIPIEKKLSITTSIASGTYTYGTAATPKVTVIEDGSSPLEVSGGAMLGGVGVLVIPRVLQLRNATLNWQGLVVVVGDGDLRAEDANVCGQILGALVIRDDVAADRKFDLDVVKQNGSCAPFAVNYSCEAVARALTLLMQTVSWTEKFDG